MRFEEAVIALCDGECESIRSKKDRGDYILYESKSLVLNVKHSLGIKRLASDFLRDDWELVNPKPQMTEEKIIGYRVALKTGGYLFLENPPEEDATNIAEVIQMKGIRLVPRKKVVKRREEIDISRNFRDRPWVTRANIDSIPVSARFYVEWEEII